MELPLFKDLARDEPKFGCKEWISVSGKLDQLAIH